MIDKIASIFTTALAVTAVGIALRPKAPTAQVLTAGLNGFAGIERAAAGN